MRPSRRIPAAKDVGANKAFHRTRTTARLSVTEVLFVDREPEDLASRGWSWVREIHTKPH